MPISAKKRGGAVGDFLRPRNVDIRLRAGIIGVRYVDDKSTCVDRGIVAVLRGEKSIVGANYPCSHREE